MMVTILAMAARITHITVHHLRRRIGMAMVTAMVTGATEHMGDMVGTEAIPDGLPQRRALGPPRCVLARPPNPLEGDESLREARSGHPPTRPNRRAGNQRRAGGLLTGAVVLARAEAARNSGL